MASTEYAPVRSFMGVGLGFGGEGLDSDRVSRFGVGGSRVSVVFGLRLGSRGSFKKYLLRPIWGLYRDHHPSDCAASRPRRI